MSITVEGLTLNVTPVSTRTPAVVPYGRNVGKQAKRITQVRETTADGAEVTYFECNECQRAFDTYAGAQGHLGAHPKGPDGRTTRSGRQAHSQAVREIKGLIQESEALHRKVETLKQKLDEERSRRVKAENRIRQIERLFGGRVS
jgi:hypothetical protein